METSHRRQTSPSNKINAGIRNIIFIFYSTALSCIGGHSFTILRLISTAFDGLKEFPVPTQIVHNGNEPIHLNQYLEVGRASGLAGLKLAQRLNGSAYSNFRTSMTENAFDFISKSKNDSTSSFLQYIF